MGEFWSLASPFSMAQHALHQAMTPEDEKELRRLTDMLAAIDAGLPAASPHRRALEKAGIALSVAFLHQLRPEIEDLFQASEKDLTEDERLRLRQLGFDPRV
jgi:hypothetical protein